MDIFKIIMVAMVGVVAAGIFKGSKSEFTIYVVLATVIIIFFMAFDKLVVVFAFMENIYDQVTYGKMFFPILLKVLAIAYITDFTAQICKDAGEAAIGSKVEFAGKIIIFYLSIPILVAILDLINSIL